jgi:hypothetical protein
MTKVYQPGLWKHCPNLGSIGQNSRGRAASCFIRESIVILHVFA